MSIYFQPGGREPKAGTAKALWDKVVRETGQPPTYLMIIGAGRRQRIEGAASHEMEATVDGQRRTYLVWWPTKEDLAKPLRECFYNLGLNQYWIG